MTEHYFNMKGEPVSQQEGLKLFAGDRHVAKTKIGDVEISTVLLVINHGFGGGPPIIFETMIFGGEHDQEQWRYSTLENAKAGHEHAVKLVKGN